MGLEGICLERKYYIRTISVVVVLLMNREVVPKCGSQASCCLQKLLMSNFWCCSRPEEIFHVYVSTGFQEAQGMMLSANTYLLSVITHGPVKVVSHCLRQWSHASIVWQSFFLSVELRSNSLLHSFFFLPNKSDYFQMQLYTFSVSHGLGISVSQIPGSKSLILHYPSWMQIKDVRGDGFTQTTNASSYRTLC